MCVLSLFVTPVSSAQRYRATRRDAGRDAAAGTAAPSRKCKVVDYPSILKRDEQHSLYPPSPLHPGLFHPRKSCQVSSTPTSQSNEISSKPACSLNDPPIIGDIGSSLQLDGDQWILSSAGAGIEVHANVPGCLCPSSSPSSFHICYSNSLTHSLSPQLTQRCHNRPLASRFR